MKMIKKTWKIGFFVGVICGSICLTSCQKSDNEKKEIAELQKEISSLKDENNEMRKNNLLSRVDAIDAKLQKNDTLSKKQIDSIRTEIASGKISYNQLLVLDKKVGSFEIKFDSLNKKIDREVEGRKAGEEKVYVYLNKVDKKTSQELAQLREKIGMDSVVAAQRVAENEKKLDEQKKESVKNTFRQKTPWTRASVKEIKFNQLIGKSILTVLGPEETKKNFIDGLSKVLNENKKRQQFTSDSEAIKLLVAKLSEKEPDISKVIEDIVKILEGGEIKIGERIIKIDSN